MMTHDFKKTLKVNDVLSGQMKTVEFENETMCIVNVGKVKSPPAESPVFTYEIKIDQVTYG